MARESVRRVDREEPSDADHPFVPKDEIRGLELADERELERDEKAEREEPLDEGERASGFVQRTSNGGRAVVPSPDFRYVALVRTTRHGRERAALVGALVGFGFSVCAGLSTLPVFGLALAGAVSGLFANALVPVGRDGPLLALVPWGVLVESEEAPRALLWSSVKQVKVDMAHGRDGGNTTTLASYVTVQTDRESFFGTTPGAAPLDRLEAHLEAYASEQGTPLSLDLDGTVPCDPSEPDGERLVAIARSWVDSGAAHDRLGLRAASYRRATAHAPTDRAVEVLREILRERPEGLDARGFAAVVAVELGATELVDDLVALVQTPHPMVAALAKQAALLLGASSSRVGSLDEVAPFLHAQDEHAIREWAARKGHLCESSPAAW
jgi:hypothetical protein